MNELLETIRVATTEKATAEEKSAGAQACRTLLAALDAEAGKPLTLGGTSLPTANPLAGIDLTKALDFLIERLRESVPAERPTPTPKRSVPGGLRLTLVSPPGLPPRKR